MNRINLLTIGVQNIRSSLLFYKEMGFTAYVKDENPAIVFFDNKGTKLALYPIQALAEDINKENPPSFSTEKFCGVTFACNVKSEEEVDSILLCAEKSGGKVVKKAQKTSWGGYSGYFSDPDGYIWEVAYAAFWKFDNNDMLIIEP